MDVCDATSDFKVSINDAVIDSGAELTSVSLPKPVLKKVCEYCTFGHDGVRVVGGRRVEVVALYTINGGDIRVNIHGLGTVKIWKLHVFPVTSKNNGNIYELQQEALVGRDVLFEYDSRISRSPVSLNIILWDLDKIERTEDGIAGTEVTHAVKGGYPGQFRWMFIRDVEEEGSYEEDEENKVIKLSYEWIKDPVVKSRCNICFIEKKKLYIM